MKKAPNLRPHEGSWVVVRKGTLQPVVELHMEANANACARSPSYDVLTVGDYLSRVNAAAKVSA